MEMLSRTDSSSEWVTFKMESGAVASGPAVTANGILWSFWEFQGTQLPLTRSSLVDRGEITWSNSRNSVYGRVYADCHN
jgi:hypothetical protein